VPIVKTTVFFTVTDQEQSNLDIIDDPEQRLNDLMNTRYCAWEQDHSADFYCCSCEHGWHVVIFDVLCKHFHLTNWNLLLAERLGVFKGEQLENLYSELSILIANLATGFPAVRLATGIQFGMLDYVLSLEPETYLEGVKQSIVLAPGMWDYDEMDGLNLIGTFFSFLKTLHHSISETQQEQKSFLFGYLY
jgi:hypothetical protein